MSYFSLQNFAGGILLCGISLLTGCDSAKQPSTQVPVAEKEAKDSSVSEKSDVPVPESQSSRKVQDEPSQYLIRNGESMTCIVVAPNAPRTVKMAPE